IVCEPSESPPCTQGFEASTVDAGLHTSAALRTGLGLATWGADGVGQLGRGGVGETNKPSHECGSTQNGSCVVDLIGVEQFDMSTDYGHLRLSSGIVHGWGDNSVGTLGVGASPSTSSEALPVAVSGGSTLTGIVYLGQSASQTVFAIMSDGSIRGWGSNADGQLAQTSSELCDLTGCSTVAAVIPTVQLF